MATPTASTHMLAVPEPRRYGSTLSLEEKCQQSFFLFYYYRMEDEAVLDRGASFLKHLCDEEEVEGKTLEPMCFYDFCLLSLCNNFPQIIVHCVCVCLCV